MKRMTKTSAQRMVRPMDHRGAAVSVGHILWPHLTYLFARYNKRHLGPPSDPVEFICKRVPDCAFNSWSWCAVWSDGTELAHWSYKNVGSTYQNREAAAARLEVDDQIVPHRKFGHAVHHAEVPFSILLQEFKKQQGIDKIDVSEVPEHTYEHRFVDRGLAALWSEYHAAHAKLEVVSDAEHKDLHSAR